MQADTGHTATAMAVVANQLRYHRMIRKPGDRLSYKFENESRMNWHFFPNWSGRTGTSLNHLSSGQQECVKKLLNLLLSSDALLEQEDIRQIHGLKKLGFTGQSQAPFITSRSLERLQLNPLGVGASKAIISL